MPTTTYDACVGTLDSITLRRKSPWMLWSAISPCNLDKLVRETKGEFGISYDNLNPTMKIAYGKHRDGLNALCAMNIHFEILSCNAYIMERLRQELDEEIGRLDLLSYFATSTFLATFLGVAWKLVIYVLFITAAYVNFINRSYFHSIVSCLPFLILASVDLFFANREVNKINRIYDSVIETQSLIEGEIDIIRRSANNISFTPDNDNLRSTVDEMGFFVKKGITYREVAIQMRPDDSADEHDFDLPRKW